jgi:hypothetical protein
MSVTAADLLKLIRAKHQRRWLVVPECKDGPTWFADGMGRFDAWCLLRSWTRERYVGYEIKVSRGDFLSDLRSGKWRKYLGSCTEFSFVVPHGLVDVREVPAEAGLLVASTNCARLYCRKPAPVRQIETPVSVLRYILMSRTAVRGEETV